MQNNRFFYADYLFAGWNTKADGSGKQYNSGDTFVIPSKNISLYAQWKKIEQKKLIYSSNTKAEEKYIDAECFSDDGEDEEKEVLIDGNSFHNNGKKFVDLQKMRLYYYLRDKKHDTFQCLLHYPEVFPTVHIIIQPHFL